MNVSENIYDFKKGMELQTVPELNIKHKVGLVALTEVNCTFLAWLVLLAHEL